MRRLLLLIAVGMAVMSAAPGDMQAAAPRPQRAGAAGWLTGVHAWTRTKGAEVKLATTMDQLAARELGKDTPLPSLELCLEIPTSIACDSGADCFYSNTISWRTPTTPLPMETHPRVVFERLFGEGGTAAERLVRMQKTGSILDSVIQQVNRLEQTLGRDEQTIRAYIQDQEREDRRLEQLRLDPK